MKMGSTTYENERKEKEKITRNKSFIKEIKQKRSHKNLEGHLNLFSEGASSFLFSHKYNDAKDKVTILLNQSDALFEKLLDHLCNLSLSKIQEDRYKSIIGEYRESFRQLRICYTVDDETLISHKFNDDINEYDPEERNEQTIYSFKTDLAVILKQSILVIAKCFDESFSKISEIRSSNKTMFTFKIKEVDEVFETLVTTFYKNKMLSIIPDIVFTLESTRITKGSIIAQNYLVSKYRMNIKKGLDAFRRNVSRFYIKLDKSIEKDKNKEIACSLIIKIIKNSQTIKKIKYLSEWKRYFYECREFDSESELRKDRDKTKFEFEKLHKEIDKKEKVIRMAHKCYKFISKYANIENNQLKETEYQKVIVDILGLLFPCHIYELRYESICDEECNDEEFVDYSWHLRDGTTTLNLNKSTNKDNQYRIYFKNLKFEDINQHRDTLNIIKLLLNILSWVRSLKSLNNMLLNDEITPLRQDCKTLTIVNNVRSILDDSFNNEENYGGIDTLAENSRDLQDYLQEVCSRVFSAIHIQTECSVVLNQQESNDFDSQNENDLALYQNQDIDDALISPHSDRKQTKENMLNQDENEITYTNEMILLKSENLVIEAKILSEENNVEEVKEFGHTFNPTNGSQNEEIYGDLIVINDTTKQFIFKLLKNSIEGFYRRVKDKQDIIEREEIQNNKIAEYENELRILKDWNSFILMNMNKANVMDCYENCVISIEKYLICELAKFIDVDDINIYYTFDFKNLIKIKGDKEIIQEEVTEELSQNLKEHLSMEMYAKAPHQMITKCVSVLCNDLQHYFLINSEVSLPENANFVVKIEYKEEQEGVITTNTLQVLSNVFLQTLSHFLAQYYKNAPTYIHSQIFKVLMQNQEGMNTRNLNKDERNRIIMSADSIYHGLQSLDSIISH